MKTSRERYKIGALYREDILSFVKSFQVAEVANTIVEVLRPKC